MLIEAGAIAMGAGAGACIVTEAIGAGAGAKTLNAETGCCIGAGAGPCMPTAAMKA